LRRVVLAVGIAESLARAGLLGGISLPELVLAAAPGRREQSKNAIALLEAQLLEVESGVQGRPSDA
jgi:hypothetical protein